MSHHDRHDGATGTTADDTPTSPLLVVLAWVLVGIPLAYGLYQTLVKAFQLLTG